MSLESKFAPIIITSVFWKFVADAYQVWERKGGETLGTFSLDIDRRGKGYVITGYRKLSSGGGYYLSTTDFLEDDHVIVHSHPGLSSSPSSTDRRSLLRSNSISTLKISFIFSSYPSSRFIFSTVYL